MKNYWEEKKYVEPTLIMFDQPKKVRLTELPFLLKEYNPQPRYSNAYDVYMIEDFSFGDYSNKVKAIIESKNICVGEYGYYIKTQFWYDSDINTAFWNEKPQIGREPSLNYEKVANVEVEVSGVYVIDRAYKQKMEEKAKKIEQDIKQDISNKLSVLDYIKDNITIGELNKLKNEATNEMWCKITRVFEEE